MIKSNSKIFKITNLFFIFLIIFLFVQPILVYLHRFEQRDCDDKAVHYFASIYTNSSSKNISELSKLITPIMTNAKDKNTYLRTTFRMKTVSSYPLTNQILFLMRKKYNVEKTVKYGLFITMIVSYSALVFLTSATKLKLFKSVLIFAAIGWLLIIFNWLHLLIHSFLPYWYTPRGIAVLLIVPLMANYIQKKWVLAGLSLLIGLLLHILFGLMIGIITIFGLFLANKYIVKSMSKIKDPKEKFLEKCLISGLFIAFLTVVVIFFANNVDNINIFKARYFQQNVVLINSIKEIPKRLIGLLYVLAVFSLVISLFLIFEKYFTRYFLKEASVVVKKLFFWGIIIITLIYMNINMYKDLKIRRSGFFCGECGLVKILKIPQETNKIDLKKEDQFFISIAEFLRKD